MSELKLRPPKADGDTKGNVNSEEGSLTLRGGFGMTEEANAKAKAKANAKANANAKAGSRLRAAY